MIPAMPLVSRKIPPQISLTVPSRQIETACDNGPGLDSARPPSLISPQHCHGAVSVLIKPLPLTPLSSHSKTQVTCTSLIWCWSTLYGAGPSSNHSCVNNFVFAGVQVHWDNSSLNTATADYPCTGQYSCTHSLKTGGLAGLRKMNSDGPGHLGVRAQDSLSPAIVESMASSKVGNLVNLVAWLSLDRLLSQTLKNNCFGFCSG